MAILQRGNPKAPPEEAVLTAAFGGLRGHSAGNDAAVLEADTQALRHVMIGLAFGAGRLVDEEDAFLGDNRAGRADGLAIGTGGAEIRDDFHGHVMFLSLAG